MTGIYLFSSFTSARNWGAGIAPLEALSFQSLYWVLLGKRLRKEMSFETGGRPGFQVTIPVSLTAGSETAGLLYDFDP
jgi:hypothetical protein